MQQLLHKSFAYLEIDFSFLQLSIWNIKICKIQKSPTISKNYIAIITRLINYLQNLSLITSIGKLSTELTN